MGAFRLSILTDHDWWNSYDPTSLDNQFAIYLNTTIDAPHEALQGAPSDSKERAVLKAALKTVDDEKEAATRKLAGVARANLQPAVAEKQRKAHMTTLLDWMDHYADLIENHGRLYLKRLQVEEILRGDWTPAVTNVVPARSATPCNDYKGKHFGADSKAARYLGTMHDFYIVKALEEKAISDGLDVPGSFIFRYNALLGWDGQSGEKGIPNTQCIRVDSVGAGQHSHPFPETGMEFVSHQKLVCSALVDALEKSDFERMVEIAKYLTIIGARKGEFIPPKGFNERIRKAREQNRELPACKFW